MDVGKLRTDERAEEEGVWHDLGEGAKVKTARINNPEYQKLFSSIDKGKQEMAERGQLTEESANELFAYLTGRGLIRDWENIELDGEKLSPTPENFEKVCKIKDFRSIIRNLASDMENYLVSNQERDQGNSQRTSRGSSEQQT